MIGYIAFALGIIGLVVAALVWWVTDGFKWSGDE